MRKKTKRSLFKYPNRNIYKLQPLVTFIFSGGKEKKKNKPKNWLIENNLKN